MNILREGWHPKGKDGGGESWRGDNRGINQVAGWVGRGKNSNARSTAAQDHVSRPLAALKDPNAFGPPPKNVNFHGGAALPNETTPDRRGMGAPLSRREVQAAQSATHPAEPERAPESNAPPLPYRADRTGLKTDNLPPPPVHRPDTEEHSASVRPKAPPPRLPPRTNSQASSDTPASPSPTIPARESKLPTSPYLNQSAVSRLGKAGVSVPGFGIGQPKTPAEKINPTTSPTSVNALQGHFSRLKTGAKSPAGILPPPGQAQGQSQGTTLAEKQAALKTAQSFHKDPSSVSLADAQSAASTANNFRDRHQDQINAGATKANTWNKKYNITSRVNTFLEQQESPPPNPAQPPQAAAAAAPGPGVRKPPPPPPPPKKPGMHGSGPPPIPLGTKPSFG